jgi:hypothetical protein
MSDLKVRPPDALGSFGQDLAGAACCATTKNRCRAEATALQLHLLHLHLRSFAGELVSVYDLRSSHSEISSTPNCNEEDLCVCDVTRFLCLRWR